MSNDMEIAPSHRQVNEEIERILQEARDKADRPGLSPKEQEIVEDMNKKLFGNNVVLGED